MYVVFRDVEEREREVLVELDITAFYMADVDRLGIVKVVDEALASVDPLGNRIILSQLLHPSQLLQKNLKI